MANRRFVKYPAKLKANERGITLPHPHDPVHGTPLAGATSAEHEAKIKARHGNIPGRQPTAKR